MIIMNINRKVVVGLIICFVLSSCYPAIGLQQKINPDDTVVLINNKNIIYSNSELLTLEFSFSDPVIENDEDYIYISVEESDFNHIADGAPVLPVKLPLQEFMFGTDIISVEYEISAPVTIPITKKLSFGKCSPRGTDMDEDIYYSSNLYPSDWVTYHTGGGLSYGDHKTFLSPRIYPVRYSPLNDEIQYINHIILNITYQEPEQSLLNGNTEFELLILAPSQFIEPLQPLVNHKNGLEVFIFYQCIHILLF